MRIRPAIFAAVLAGGSFALSGCIAALVPLAAAGALGKTQILDERIGGDFEAIESYFGIGQSDVAVEAVGFASSVLAPRTDLQRPAFTFCQSKPRAVLVDIDGAVGSKLDPKLAAKRHKRLSVAAGQAQARILYFSQRDVKGAKPYEKALSRAIDAPVKVGENLFVNDGELIRRDLRRWKIAKDYCIIAQVGDRKEDFTDSYAFLKQPGAPPADALDKMIGKGWFLIPGLDPI